MHDLADVEHGIEDDWVIGGLRLPPEEGIGDGPTGLHLQRFLLQEVHKGKEPVHGKQVAEVMHVGQDLADHGQELQGGRRRGRRGGEEEGEGGGEGERRKEDLLCRATEHNVHTYVCVHAQLWWHGGTAHIRTY